MRKTLPFVITALLCGLAQAQPHLVFDHKIGTEWNADSNEWMSFVAISSDGSTVAADGNVPQVKSGGTGLWAFPTGNFLRAIPDRPIAISPDFRYLATRTSVLDLKTGRQTASTSRPGEYDHAAFSQTGEYVAVVGTRGTKRTELGQITVLRTADGSVSATFGSRFTASLAFDPDNRTLASGHWNNVTLWDSRTGVKLAVLFHGGRHTTGAGLDREGRYIYGLAFSRDGKLLAAGSDDGELQIWDVADRKLVHSLNIGGGDVSDPAFSPDGKIVAAGTYGDGTVSLVDVPSGKIISRLKVSDLGCGSVAFSPDGEYVLTPSNHSPIGRKFERGGTVRVFRLKN